MEKNARWWWWVVKFQLDCDRELLSLGESCPSLKRKRNKPEKKDCARGEMQLIEILLPARCGDIVDEMIAKVKGLVANVVVVVNRRGKAG